MKLKQIFKTIFIIFILINIIFINVNKLEASSNVEEITIGYFPNITHAPAIVGVKENIIQDNLNGIRINTHIFPNGSLFMNALNTGQIDIGYVGPGPAINRYLQGADVKALASASTGGTVLITRKDFEYNSIDDLKNSTIATPALGCTHDLLFRQFIKGNNLDTKKRGGSIDHRAQKPATMIGLFTTNQLDAAMVSEPWAARMEKDIDAKVILDWNQVPWDGKLPATILVSTSEYINENESIINSFLKAHLESIEFIQNNPVKTSKIIQKEIKNITRQQLSLSVIEDSLKRTNMTSKLDHTVVQELANLSSELGFIKGDSNLDAFIDTSYLNKLISQDSNNENSQ